ncbi:hypothetical protein IC235_19205 [Hymenobacter sp. BT664]|uniref:Periplasmic heavy metal sensor n=1 Tax=Hymenobacter montanus TaxID=2771359 RepID=A0A927GLB6_9BACT|nr:hypothetical protein [Hymenobacter montanus]MBD2770021.1 hypothetical protein [Hymenobacter montanus]
MNNLPPSLPNRSNRLPWVLVGILLLLNLALVACLCLTPATNSSAARPASGAIFLADTLRFSAAQRVRYDTLRSGYLRQVQPLARSCRRSCRQYFATLDSQLTDAQLAERSREALSHKVAVDVVTVRHLQQVAALCTPAQRQLLQRLLAQPPGDGCVAGEKEGVECILPLNR